MMPPPTLRGRSRSVLLLALACLTGCAQDNFEFFRGTLTGVYDLAHVGELLFVTSSARNELRAFDLARNPRTFVRAPNPLEPLSIPVVERATAVVRDLRYEEGAEVAGPYVYAYSASFPAISVVGADRSLLREVLRLPTGGPVSAVAAHGPQGDRNVSTLYYAIADGTGGSLWGVELPGPDAIGGAKPSPQLLLTTPGEFIVSLAVMPPVGQIAVATRAQAGRQGQTFLLETATGARRPMAFPAPVRVLLTNPGADKLPVGSRLYGLLDEEACGGTGECRGILAVDVATGGVLKDATGHPMLPITFGSALPIGLSLTSDASVYANSTSGGSTRFDLLGLGTSSEGEIFFFDAGALRHIDADPNPARALSITLRSPDNTSQPLTPNSSGPLPDSVLVTEGAARDEIVFIVMGGLIPGLVSQPTQPSDGQRFPTSSAALSHVVPGDVIVVGSPNPDCKAELPVSAVDANGVVTSAPIPAACAERNTFSIRAGEGTPRPFVVYGDASGLMGRTGPNQAFSFQGSYFYHPDGYVPTIPQLRFSMGPADSRVVRDWSYVLVTASGFRHLGFTVDTTLFPGYHLPSAIVHLPDQPTAFVAYPSANGMIEFNPPLILPNQVNAGNIKSYP